MRIDRIDVDSAVFGRSVLALKDVLPDDDLSAEEARYLQKFQPAYVSCRVPMDDLATVHRLERHGFQLIETQIRSTIRFTTDYDVSRYPYQVPTGDHTRSLGRGAGHRRPHGRARPVHG